MKNTSFARPGVFKYILGSYPGLSQLVEEEEDEISDFSASWTADCAASYVSPEILSRFTRVSLLISLISFPLPPDCFALSICFDQGADDLEHVFVTICWNKEFFILRQCETGVTGFIIFAFVVLPWLFVLVLPWFIISVLPLFVVPVLPRFVVIFLLPWLATVIVLAMVIRIIVSVIGNFINTMGLLQGKGLDLINCCRGPDVHDVIPERISNLNFLLQVQCKRKCLFYSPGLESAFCKFVSKFIFNFWFQGLNPFNIFGSTVLPIGTHLNYLWERCAPITTTFVTNHLVF